VAWEGLYFFLLISQQILLILSVGYINAISKITVSLHLTADVQRIQLRCIKILQYVYKLFNNKNSIKNTLCHHACQDVFLWHPERPSAQLSQTQSCWWH